MGNDDDFIDLEPEEEERWEVEEEQPQTEIVAGGLDEEPLSAAQEPAAASAAPDAGLAVPEEEEEKEEEGELEEEGEQEEEQEGEEDQEIEQEEEGEEEGEEDEEQEEEEDEDELEEAGKVADRAQPQQVQAGPEEQEQEQHGKQQVQATISASSPTVTALHDELLRFAAEVSVGGDGQLTVSKPQQQRHAGGPHCSYCRWCAAGEGSARRSGAQPSWCASCPVCKAAICRRVSH
jgi:hypothetical protein